jgi:aquaporin Z
MLSAAEIFLRVKGAKSVLCAKLHHQNDKRCIHCGNSKIINVSNTFDKEEIPNPKLS